VWTGPETRMRPCFQQYHEMLPKRRKMSRKYLRVFILSSLEILVARCCLKQRNIQTIWRRKPSHTFNSQIARQCLENVSGTILGTRGFSCVIWQNSRRSSSAGSQSTSGVCRDRKPPTLFATLYCVNWTLKFLILLKKSHCTDRSRKMTNSSQKIYLLLLFAAYAIVE